MSVVHKHVTDEVLEQALNQGFDSQALQDLRFKYADCPKCQGYITGYVQSKQIAALNFGSTSMG